MRRPRVTSSMKRELADLRSARSNPRRGGVMRVPVIMGPDEWEAAASASQDALITASWEDRTERSKLHPETVVTGKDPADVTDRYKPNAGPGAVR